MMKRLLMLVVATLAIGWVSPMSGAIVQTAKKGGDDVRVKSAYNYLQELQPDKAIAELTGPLNDALKENTKESLKRASRYCLFLAYAFRLDENDVSALACARMAEKLDPESTLALSYMAYYLCSFRKYDELKHYVELLKPLAVTDENAAWALGFVQSSLGLFGAAEDSLSRALQLNETDLWARVFLARLYHGSDGAEQFDAAARATDNPYFRELYLQNAAYSLDPHTKDFSHVQKAIKIHPDDPSCHVLKAACHIGQNDSKGAAEEWTAACKCRRFVMRPYLQLAVFAMFNNQKLLAEKTLQHAKRIKPEAPEIEWTLARADIIRGDNLEAERRLRKVLEVDRVGHLAHSALSFLPQIAGDPVKANQLADDWTRARPNDAMGWVFKANLLKKERKWQEAEKSYTNARNRLAIFDIDKNTQRRIEYCLVLANLGTCKYKQAKSVTPTDQGLLNQSINLALEFNGEKPAVNGISVRPGKIMLVKLENQPDKLEAARHGALADMLYESGELEDCVKEYQKAISLDKANPEWHKGALRTYMDKGDWAAAAVEDIAVSNDIVTNQLPNAIKQIVH